MYYDYRYNDNSLFEIEFPEDLNENSRNTLLESVIGADIENGHLKILLSSIIEHPELVIDSYIIPDKNGNFVRKEAHFVPYYEMKASLLGNHEYPVAIVEYDRSGNITKRTEYMSIMITELSNDSAGVLLDVQYDDAKIVE